MPLKKRMDVLKVSQLDVRQFGLAILAGMFLVLTVGTSLPSMAQQRPTPYSVEDVEALLQGGVSPVRVVALVREDCRDFLLSETVERRLRESGADDATLAALREACFIPPATVALDTLGVIQPDALPVTEVAAPASQSPTVHVYPDQYTRPGDVLTFNLREVFGESDREWVSFGSPSSNDLRVATVNLLAEQLTVVPHEPGLALIAVSAFDDAGREARLAFAVTVEAPERRGNNGLKFAIGGGVAALAGAVAYLVLGANGSGGEAGQGNGVTLPGHPGLPPAE